MDYMMSKSAYLTDQGEHNVPHVMFYTALEDGKDWGGGRIGLAGACCSLLVPIVGASVASERAAADSCVPGRSGKLVRRNGRTDASRVDGLRSLVRLWLPKARSARRVARVFISHLSDVARSWHPHLMFVVSGDAAKSWEANQPGSPIMAVNDPEERVTIFLVWVGQWSDGTPGPLR